MTATPTVLAPAAEALPSQAGSPVPEGASAESEREPPTDPQEVRALPREEPDRTLSLEFRGSAREYFRIWIVNLFLTVVTLGIYSAWAKVRKKRYFHACTLIDGTPFRYLGQPLPILKGRLIALGLFGTYWAATRVYDTMLPFVLLGGLALAPWILSRAAAFNARCSSYRGMTFRFEASYAETARALGWGLLLPAFVVGTAFSWWNLPVIAGFGTLVFGALFPVWLSRVKRFFASHTSYGGRNVQCEVMGGELWWVYFRGGLLLIPFAIAAGVMVAMMPGSGRGPSSLSQVAFVAIIALGYLLTFAFIRAHGQNCVWNRTRLGPLKFRSDMRALEVFGLYVTNLGAIVLTFGLATPWAVVRALRYRAAHTRIENAGELAEFRQQAPAGDVRAMGAETTDFFDVDLSL